MSYPKDFIKLSKNCPWAKDARGIAKAGHYVQDCNNSSPPFYKIGAACEPDNCGLYHLAIVYNILLKKVPK